MSTKKTKTKDRFGGLKGAVLFWIHRVDQATRQEILNEFRRGGHQLTAPQWDVMTVLWQRDGITQTELATAAGSDKATITRILDRMVREGLVERRADPEDRRAFRIHLRNAGKELHKQLIPIVDAIITRAFDTIDESQQEMLQSALERIFRNLTRL